MYHLVAPLKKERFSARFHVMAVEGASGKVLGDGPQGPIIAAWFIVMRQ